MTSETKKLTGRARALFLEIFKQELKHQKYYIKADSDIIRKNRKGITTKEDADFISEFEDDRDAHEKVAGIIESMIEEYC